MSSTVSNARSSIDAKVVPNVAFQLTPLIHDSYFKKTFYQWILPDESSIHKPINFLSRKSKPMDPNHEYCRFTFNFFFQVHCKFLCVLFFRCVLASLYEGLSVRPSVRPSVRMSVGPYVRPLALSKNRRRTHLKFLLPARACFSYKL